MTSIYRVTIDSSLCIGYGSCAQLAPDAFRLEDGVAVALMAETTDPRVLEAEELCPMSAIAVEEVEAA